MVVKYWVEKRVSLRRMEIAWIVAKRAVDICMRTKKKGTRV